MSDFIDDFISEYQNNPCLWKADSANYKNRSKRQEAYAKLIAVAHKHNEHYNVERTKQKINNLRCAFRHQLKKYNELKNKGEKEEPYCPKRKYFESLMFLRDEETKDKRVVRTESSEIVIVNVGTNNGKTGAVSRLLSTDESGSVGDSDKGDKAAASNNNGGVVEDPLHVPNNLFSDLCKEIHKDNNVNETDEDNEDSAVSISVVADKLIPLSQDIEEIVINPVKKDQASIVENTGSVCVVANTSSSSTNISSPQKPLNQQQNSNKCRKRSSSFSSQHSNETSDTATPIKTTKTDITLDIENLLSLACKSFQKNTVDHHNSFGDIVAHKLRSMEAKQAIYAEKIISDILYQGQMKFLSPAAIERCSHLERLQHQREHK